MVAGLSPNGPKFKDAFQPQARAFSSLVSLLVPHGGPPHPHSSEPHSSHLPRNHQPALPHPFCSWLPGWITSSHLLQGHSCVSQGHTANCVFSPHGVSFSDLILLEGGPGYVLLASQLPSFLIKKKKKKLHESTATWIIHANLAEHEAERASLPSAEGFESCLSSLCL